MNIDGTGAIAARTVTGVALPSGYIRTTVDTEMVYDGTFWVLSRAVERGSNANGEFTRFEDGLMLVWRSGITLDSTITTVQDYESPAVFVSGNVGAGLALSVGSGAAGDRFNDLSLAGYGYAASATPQRWDVKMRVAGSRDNNAITLSASGAWY